MLEHALVEGAGINARDKILEVLKWTMRFAFRDYFERRLFAHALDTG